MSKSRMTVKEYLAYLQRGRDKKGSWRERKRLGDKMYGSSAKGLKTALKWGSETERRYYCEVLKFQGEYEAETIAFTPEYFAPKDKHRYTPDFVTKLEGIKNCGADIKVYHEVKGSYRLGSQDGARLRWCMAALARPDAVFVWAKERTDKRWDIEIWYDGGRTRLKQLGVLGFRFIITGGVEWQR